MRKKLSSVIAFGTVLAMGISLAGCSSGKTQPESSAASGASSAASSAASSGSGPVTLKVFFSNPDQTQGLGLLEANGIKEWSAKHPDIKISLETLQDDPYQKKFQTYLASGDVPDVYKSWNSPAFITPAIKGGYAAVLEPKDYASYGYGPGALEAYTFDGKLYGIPMFADTWVLYYNQKILSDNGIKVPGTFDDLLTATKALRAKGIQPCAMDGKDGWPLMFTYQNIALRESGSQSLIYDACTKKTSFSKESALLAAAEDMKKLSDEKFFMDGYVSADYGTARSMFVQGKAAMFLMGSWEMGMSTDASVAEDIRSSIRATKFPVIAGKGNIDDLIYRIGGGYSVNAKSTHLAQAKEFANFMTSPDIWAKNAWQKSICQTPYDITKYKTGKEPKVQLDLFDILQSGKTTSGLLFGDKYTPAFQTDTQKLMTAFASGMYSPKDLMSQLDSLVSKDLT